MRNRRSRAGLFPRSDRGVFGAMMNFVFGTVAGALLASLMTIVAVRQPTIQARLGLFPVSTAPILPAARTPSPHVDAASRPCRAPRAEVGKTDMLFDRKRFWLVAP
jgi:hypothetical protein